VQRPCSSCALPRKRALSHPKPRRESGRFEQLPRNEGGTGADVGVRLSALATMRGLLCALHEQMSRYLWTLLDLASTLRPWSPLGRPAMKEILMGFKRTLTLVAIGAVAVGAALLGACAPAPVAPETTTSTTVPAPPKYLFEFNRTNEPTVDFSDGAASTRGLRSGQLGTNATTSVSGSVRVDCTGLSGQTVEVVLTVRHNAIPAGFDGYKDAYFFSGACNTEIPVSIPSTSFVGTDSFWLIPLQPGGFFGPLFPPVGTLVTFAIHSDALVPGTISL